jgi:hypothetical protein
LLLQNSVAKGTRFATIFATGAAMLIGPCTSANGDGCGTQQAPPASTGEAWREKILYNF